MFRRLYLGTGFLVAFLAQASNAQELVKQNKVPANLPSVATSDCLPGRVEVGVQPELRPEANPAAPVEDLRPGYSPLSATNTAFPEFFSDLAFGGFAQRVQVINGQLVRTTVPNIGRTAFKIIENENPQPTDRVYATYNYYNNVIGGVDGFDLHRQIFGAEKTFLDGKASVGVRVPFLQVDGLDDSGAGLGDISIVFKYALLNRPKGNVLSVGLVATLPTSQSINTGIEDTLQDVLYLQPFVGYRVVGERAFLQGFSSLAVPTEAGEANPVLLFNSVGLGYQLVRPCDNGFFRRVTPMLEGHLTTPLDNRNFADGTTNFPDIFVLTGGVHFGLGERWNLSIAGMVPLTGPRVYEFETMIRLGLQF